MNEYKLSITLGDKAYVCKNNANDEDVIIAEFDSHDEAEKYIDNNFKKIRDGSNYHYYIKKIDSHVDEIFNIFCQFLDDYTLSEFIDRNLNLTKDGKKLTSLIKKTFNN